MQGSNGFNKLKFIWNHRPEESLFAVVECKMILPFGRAYFCRLHNADFMPPINDTYKQKTHKDVERILWNNFLRFIGAA